MREREEEQEQEKERKKELPIKDETPSKRFYSSHYLNNHIH